MSPGIISAVHQLVVFLVFLRFDAFVPVPASHFLAPDGSDANSGTIDSPWRSLSVAVHRMNPGDTLFVRGGSYHQKVVIEENDGGMSGYSKTIKAFMGEIPLWSGEDRFSNRTSYIKFEGMHYALPYSLESSGDHVEIINCEFHGSQPRYAAIEFGGDFGLIRGNRIEVAGPEGTTTDHGIYIHAGGNHLIQGNYITGTSGYGLHLYDERKSWDAEGTLRLIHDVVVEGNTISYSRKRSGILVSFGKSARVEGVIIQGNVLFANNHNGILVKRGENIELRNNTYFNNGCQGVNLGDGDGTNLYSVTFVNNIVVQEVNGNCKENCTWYPLAHLDSGKNASLVHATNNLYWPDHHIYGIEDKKPIFADPEFKDSRNSDFHLTSGSPAIDSGVFVGAPFTGTAPDLGALEYLGKESEYAIALKGFLVGKSVILSWETTLPEHLHLFDVERSQNYVQYEKIAEVAGGTGSSYQFIDKNPVLDRCYYRVIQRNLDGSTRFSSTIEIRRGR